MIPESDDELYYLIQEMREVAGWLRGVYGNNTGFWVNAWDAYALDNDGVIYWIVGSGIEVNASFWLPSEPDHYDNDRDVDKDCVYLNLEDATNPGLAVEECGAILLYPLCKI